jgi:hypothetical protein
LPLGVDVSDPAQIAPDVSATVEALVSGLRSVSATQVADRLGASAVLNSRPGPLEPLAQADALRTMDEQTLIEARPHLRSAARSDGDRLALRLPDRLLELPSAAAKTVTELLDGARLRVGDLPGMDPVEGLALAKRLVREGFAVTVAPGAAR